MNLEKILPSREELSFVQLPDGLNYSFAEAVQRDVANNIENPIVAEKPFDHSQISDLNGFFESIGDVRTAAPPLTKKSSSRRSLDNNSSAKRNSVSMIVEEFPIALLKDNVSRVNNLTGDILEQIDKIRSIEYEKQTFSRMIEQLEDSVKKWSDKTQMLANKTKNQPQYEKGDEFLSQDSQKNIKLMELLLRNLKSKKGLETKLGENNPDPEANTEDMSYIKQLVAEFINDVKNG